MERLFEDLYPVILSAAGLIISAVGAYIAFLIHKKTGIDIIAAKKAIESGDRDAFHKALETAAKLAVEKGLIGQEAVDWMLEYAGISTPEAVEGLNPSRMLAEQIAESKLIDETKAKKVEEVKEVVATIKDAAARVTEEQASGFSSVQTSRELQKSLDQATVKLG